VFDLSFGRFQSFVTAGDQADRTVTLREFEHRRAPNARGRASDDDDVTFLHSASPRVQRS